ncbi:MAG: SusF/SusE family outer membrane protein [Flavobacterium sp.]|nr:MAG: SusF/SusE family outer membrane protein [Flavobacterium sp.]
MKTKLKIALMALLVAGMSSCTDDDNFMQTRQEGSFELTGPDAGATVTLTPDLSTNPALTISWKPATYTTPTEINYTVQVSGTSEFETFTSFSSVTTLSRTLTVEELNGAAIAAGLEADVPGTLNVRVMAYIGNEQTDPMYSNVMAFTVTPYVTYPFKDLYLVGSASPTGWDNNADTNHYPLFRDGADANLYRYTGYFAVGEFKLIGESGSWVPQYGFSGGSIVAKLADSDPDPATMQVATAGYYALVVNLNDNTYTFEQFEATGAATYGTIGIIGTSTPQEWTADTDMTQSTIDPHMWFITNQFLTAGGELKFRADNDWAVNWGGATSFSGVGSLGGSNIPIGIAVDGNYDVWFNDLTGLYIYIPTE